MIDVVFNSASLQPPLVANTEAFALMSRLVEMLAMAPTEGYERSLRIPPEFYTLELASSYSITDWLNDPRVRTNEKRLLRERATRSPLLAGADASVLAREFGMAVSIDGEEQGALRAAYLLDAATMSLCRAPWDRSHFDAVCQRLDEADIDGELLTESIRLPNLACAEHYATHASWATQRKRLAALDLRQLWEQRHTLLDRLLFCLGTERQMLSTDIAATNQAAIRNRLFELQAYCERWELGGFDRNAFSGRCDPTSVRTMEEHGEKYTFALDAGAPVVCGWHLRLAMYGWRIYFSPDPEARRIIIGHIGEHLPTATRFT